MLKQFWQTVEQEIEPDEFMQRVSDMVELIMNEAFNTDVYCEETRVMCARGLFMLL